VTRALFVAAALSFVVACGDNTNPNQPDSSIGPDGPEMNVDAPIPATFTLFVIDLIENQTSDTTEPVPFAIFVPLPDPDLENPDAYDSLFP
jgi:hypothetical protein